MILIIDNYDSFTYNLAHLVGTLCADMTVVRNDEIQVGDIVSMRPEAIILSPGPCTPDDAGICMELATAAAGANLPLLGVCLGHQSLAQAFGARVVRAGNLMHGKTSSIEHTGDSIFAGLPDRFAATRYHSLTVDPESLTGEIQVLATSADDKEIMGIRIKGKPLYGVQFHPESIASEHGTALVRNFLDAGRRGKTAA